MNIYFDISIYPLRYPIRLRYLAGGSKRNPAANIDPLSLCTYTTHSTSKD